MKTKILNKQLRQARAAGLCFSLLLASAFLFVSTSFAHQQKTAVTRILFNPNTDNIEVMHRFFIHDAEHAASLIFGGRQSLLESEESRQLFSTYVMNRFAIEATFADGEKRELELDHVGEEVDGQFLWVYQEVPISEAITAMTIVHLALRDVWPDQANLVNIERDGEFFSLQFAGGAEALGINLPI